VRESGRELEVRWRCFSLAQVNSTRGEGWTVWGATEPGDDVRGREAFKAAEAARRQERFEELHMALLRARHERKLDLDERSTILEAAREAGLDLERLERDMADPGILDRLARDHQEGVAEHGVFGTPTFVFPGGGTAYVRIRPAPEGEAAVTVFDQLASIVATEPWFLELKRPDRR
jgi:predicted DsbA family dithiol-disulfide isomerase